MVGRCWHGVVAAVVRSDLGRAFYAAKSVVMPILGAVCHVCIHCLETRGVFARKGMQRHESTCVAVGVVERDVVSDGRRGG